MGMEFENCEEGFGKKNAKWDWYPLPNLQDTSGKQQRRQVVLITVFQLKVEK